jgi:pimeloyl-ACP methyl ester carboxylesterase
VAVALVLLVPLLAACQPAPDSFYQDPAPLPGAPGGIARQTQVGFNGRPTPQSTVVLYQSTDVAGAPMLVSGTIMVPETPWTGPGTRPLVAYAPATQGVADPCAPSKTLAYGGNYEILVYEALLNAGFAIAITDYQGLGTPGDHTYTVATAGATALLDMARAAINLPQAGLDAQTPVLLAGYSLGGQAVTKAAEIEPFYAPELNIIGASAGGVPADLLRVGGFLNTDGRLYFSFLGLTAVGLDAAYPELDLDSYLNARGRALIADARDECVVGALLTGLGASIEDATDVNPLDTPQWQARLGEQRIGTVAPQIPVYLYHGQLDEVIPVEIGAGLRQDWCARGANVTWNEYAGADHITLEFTAIADMVAFLNSRVYGIPAVPNC